MVLISPDHKAGYFSGGGYVARGGVARIPMTFASVFP